MSSSFNTYTQRAVMIQMLSSKAKTSDVFFWLQLWIHSFLFMGITNFFCLILLVSLIGSRIIQETNLWACLLEFPDSINWGKKARLTGGIIPWVGVLEQMKRRKQDEPQPYLSASWPQMQHAHLSHATAHVLSPPWWTVTPALWAKIHELFPKWLLLGIFVTIKSSN